MGDLRGTEAGWIVGKGGGVGTGHEFTYRVFGPIVESAIWKELKWRGDKSESMQEARQ